MARARRVLRWLLAASLAAASLPSLAATVSGTVTVPPSETGYQRGPGALRVVVDGTALGADVVPSAPDAGTFEIAGVPAGRVTLALVEGNPGFPWSTALFTAASTRVAVDVGEGGLAGVTFALAHRWREVPAYPATWATAWWTQAQFTSATTAFVYLRAGDPDVRIVYRTVDAGATWTEIGRWTYDQAAWLAGTPFPAASFHFSDADHGVLQAEVYGVPCSPTAGFLVTGDGGATWDLAPLQMPGVSYGAVPLNIAHAGPDLLVAAGRTGCGVQGYSSGFHDAVWESASAGAEWALALSTAVSDVASRGCTALGVGPGGDAVAWFTPLFSDLGPNAERWVARRSAEGAWSLAEDPRHVVLVGHVPFVGARAWMASLEGTEPAGTYRSDDAGATWTRILDGAVSSLDFATSVAGLALGGAGLYATQDGGATWLLHGVGGGTAYAFGEASGGWVTDPYLTPSGRRQLLTLTAPPVPAFTLLPGAALAPGPAAPGARSVPLLAFRVLNSGGVALRGFQVALRAAGTGDDAGDVARARLWLDPEGDGSLGPEDEPLAQAAFAADDGRALLTVPADRVLAPGDAVALLVTYDLAAPLARGGTFTAGFAALDVAAETATAAAAKVAAAGDPLASLAGRTVTATRPVPAPEEPGGASGCGCGAGAARGAGPLALLALWPVRRRRRDGTGRPARRGAAGRGAAPGGSEATGGTSWRGASA